jgi:peptide/nickel transport system substrate-binding protein
MKTRFVLGILLVTLALFGCQKTGQRSANVAVDPNQEVAPGVKRGDTLILEDPSGRLVNPDNFNVWTVWAGGGGGVSNGLQQLAMDTLWYIDPDEGLNHQPWYNSLAADKPIYNKDFTRMKAKLRQGIYWSDGVEFTANDIVYTVETLMENPTALFGSNFQVFVKKVSAPDKYTVVFDLTKPNSRFHRNFTVRWNACWIMPKHVWEKALTRPQDAMTYTFNPPVSLGPYVLKSYDKQGTWTIWERRKDWKRTTIADYGMPMPKYAMYIDPGPSDKRVIAQSSHQLDMIHEVTPEGIIKLAENKWENNWFGGFPWGHPDPTLIAVLINNAKEPFNNKDVRWALALSLDMTKLAMASYKGAVTLSAIHFPPTGGSRKWYFDPLQSWLKNLEIDTGKGKIKPYDTTVALRIADEARKNFGDAVPKDPEKIRDMIGLGWWKHDPETAAALLEKNGYTRKNGKWYKPNGAQFKINVLNWGSTNPILVRLGTMVAELWTKFGIESTAVSGQDTMTRLQLGDFDTGVFWNIETWGGHPDLSFFVDTWHSDFYKPVGTVTSGRNFLRYKSTALDKIINEINVTDFDSPRNIELGLEFLKLTTIDMPSIPLMSYNVFSSQDTTFWDGYPNFEHPYANPVTNWANSRYIFTQLKQKLPPTK